MVGQTAFGLSLPLMINEVGWNHVLVVVPKYNPDEMVAPKQQAKKNFDLKVAAKTDDQREVVWTLLVENLVDTVIAKDQKVVGLSM